MGLLDKEPRNKKAFALFTFLLAAGALLYVVKLVSLSSKVNNLAGREEVTQNGTFGPLILYRLSKSPLDGGGYEASMAFAGGSALYFAFWFLIAVMLAWAYLASRAKTN
jgi:hypothetical protein